MSPVAAPVIDLTDTAFDLLMVTEGMDSRQCDVDREDGNRCPNVAAYLAHCPNPPCASQAFWCEACHQFIHKAVEVRGMTMSCDSCGKRTPAIFPHYKL